MVECKIPTPSQYRKIKNTQKYIAGGWNDKSVHGILSNEVYLGHTVQHKKEKINYKLDREIEIPRAQWVKVENTHEPIISLEDFYTVQKLLEKKGRVYTKRTVHAHLLSRSVILRGLPYANDIQQVL